MERQNKTRNFSTLESKHGLPLQIELNHRVAVRRFINESCELAKTLPPKKKLLFLMRFELGFSISEIAQLCGVHEETARNRIDVIVNEINQMRKCCNGDDNAKKNTDKKTK